MRTLFLLLPALVLCGCNKDDVIEPETPVADSGFRPATSTSSPYQTTVYEYLPGPGQFVNETVTAGFTGDEVTMARAAEYALGRLASRKFVSLGSFGGYIVVGFDHSIAPSGHMYDFAILGNAFDTSNEPGTVLVMQDTNRNGLPDDTWYELRGSETGNAATVSGYSVTYHRPAAPGMPVEWTASDGKTGTVDYLKAYHRQDYYYPAWVETDSYTLSGTLLEARNSQDPSTGFWTNSPFGWGYADNLGSDLVAGEEPWVGFRISNAVAADGSPASIAYVDFIMVRQAVLAKSGWLGENSCEVCSFADYSMLW